MEALLESLSGLDDFFAYLSASLVMVAIYCAIYLRVTPYAEITMIKEGRTAPAVSFAGSLLGFVLPLASAVSHSVGFIDMIVWAVVALCIQIGVFLAVRICCTEIVKGVADDRLASAIFLAVCSLAAGILNAASMTY